MRSLISEIIDKVGQEVQLAGYVGAVRDHGRLIFFDLLDRSGEVQVVLKSSALDLKPQDIVMVKGKVRKRPAHLVNPKIASGQIEIESHQVTILVKSHKLPFDLTAPELHVSLPTLLDYRALTLRHPKIKAIFQVQEVIIGTFRRTLKGLGFTEFQAPIIIPSTSEGGAEVFPVQYFKHTAYLAQSPQLYKQIMLAVFERVFTVTHAFRAEPSVTTRHLTEYISLDAEMAFISSWEELMDTVEYLIKSIVEAVGSQCLKQLEVYSVTLPQISKPFPRIQLSEAQEIIYKRTQRDIRGEPDLSPADEEEIWRWSKEEHNCDFVFVTHFPVEKRPFYTFADPNNPHLTLSFDLIGLGLELVTGGQRINDYQQLVANIKKWGNDPKDFDLYLQAFKYGIPPEGGFALGAERITAKLLGLANVREASLFPRDMERIDKRLTNHLKDENTG